MMGESWVVVVMMMAAMIAMAMVIMMVVMMIRRRKSRVTHHSDAMRGHEEFIEMIVKNDRWWRSNLKIAFINFRNKV